MNKVRMWVQGNSGSGKKRALCLSGEDNVDEQNKPYLGHFEHQTQKLEGSHILKEIQAVRNQAKIVAVRKEREIHLNVT